MYAQGSSPLTRGKRDARFLQYLDHGLIPAHAGKTTLWTATRSPVRAHPRSRGENVFRRVVVGVAGGSSPLTRGKHEHARELGVLVGLIPAHAGKTRGRRRRTCPARAHPRSRGENGGLTLSGHSDWGSSPLTRGKHLRGALPKQRDRLIPAHAGKTDRARPIGRGKRAHPRSRGENMASREASPGVRGSSPLTRGKQNLRYLRWNEGRLIPAHAGKTAQVSHTITPTRAHPRSRGENLIGVAADLSAQGSSPLTRGKHDGARVLGEMRGLIPAHAGKTSWARGRAARRPAHPRSRGENSNAGHVSS